MKRTSAHLLPLLLALLLPGLSATATVVIYEPFEDTEASLAGNSSGSGLTGTWSSNGGAVLGTSINFGTLRPALGGSAQFNNQWGAVSLDPSLSAAGLLDDGQSLWFSFLVTTGGDIATNGDLGFVLGTDRISSGNNIPVQNGGQALGVRFKNNQLRAAHWSPGIVQSAGGSVSPSTTYLIAGRFIWGASADTVEVYNVSPTLDLGSVVSSLTTSSNVDQSLFDTFSIGSKAANPNHFIDEIRFGSTAASVLPIPEPSPTLLGGLGMLALLLHRRRR